MPYGPATRDRLTYGLSAAGGKRLVVATGGSGGHIYPALAFAEEFERREPGSHLFFTIGSRPIEEQLMRKVPKENVFKLFGKPRNFHRDFGYARDLLRSLRAEAVVGFGGYTTVPVVVAAWSLGIPVLIHEQNAAPGLANRLLAPLATRVAVSFPISKPSGPKAVQTGMPLRSALRRVERVEALRALGLDPARKTFLICGGSQGARALNEAVQTFVRGAGNGFARDWQIVHLAGAADFEAQKAFYEGVSVPHRLFSFYEDMSIIYSGADLVLSRAGSLTVHELAFFAKSAALVPYPGARAHQAANAEILREKGAAKIIWQNELGAERVAGLVAEAEKDPAGLAETGAKLAALLKTDGAGVLVEEVLKMAVESSS